MNDQIKKIISSMGITKKASEKSVDKEQRNIPETAKELLKLSQEVSEIFAEPKKESEQEPEKTKETAEEKADVEKSEETKEETPHKEAQEKDKKDSDKKVDEESEKRDKKEPEKKDEKEPEKKDEKEPEKKDKEANLAIGSEDVHPPPEPEQEPEKAPDTEEHEPVVLKDKDTQEEKPDIVKVDGTQDAEQKLGAFKLPPNFIRGGVLGAGILGAGAGGYQIGRAKERTRDPLIVNANAQAGFNQGYETGAKGALDALMAKMPAEMQKAITGGMQNAVLGKEACLGLEKNAIAAKWLAQNKLMLGLGAAGAAGAGIGGFALGKKKEQANDAMLGQWGSRRGYNLGYQIGAANVIDSIRSKIPKNMQEEFNVMIGGGNG